MIYVCRCLFHSLRNLIYYRNVRNDPAAVRQLLKRLEACNEQESNDTSGNQCAQDLLTEFILCNLGLTTINDPKDDIPRGVWQPLGGGQRDFISKVNEFCYRAGLRW